MVIISTKLKAMLLLDGDADQLEYALHQIGREVPEDAMHLDRLLDLRESLERKVASLVADRDPAVAEVAHRYLVNKAGGLDLGGGPGSSFVERQQAAYRWRQWLLTGRLPGQMQAPE